MTVRLIQSDEPVNLRCFAEAVAKNIMRGVPSHGRN